MMRNKKQLDTFEDTKEKALRLLEFRNHSEKELTDKLARLGASSENIERTVEFLNGYKLINDENYAEAFARDLHHLKGYGKNRIRSELYAKGIDGAIIDTVLEELDDNDLDLLTEKIKKRLNGDFEKKSRDRVTRYFVNKGYSFDEIRSCIEKTVQSDENQQTNDL